MLPNTYVFIWLKPIIASKLFKIILLILSSPLELCLINFLAECAETAEFFVYSVISASKKLLQFKFNEVLKQTKFQTTSPI